MAPRPADGAGTRIPETDRNFEFSQNLATGFSPATGDHGADIPTTRELERQGCESNWGCGVRLDYLSWPLPACDTATCSTFRWKMPARRLLRAGIFFCHLAEVKRAVLKESPCYGLVMSNTRLIGDGPNDAQGTTPV